MLDLCTNGEQGFVCELPASSETILATGPIHKFYTASILDEPIYPLSLAWNSVPPEPGGNDTQAFRPGTKDPTISAALSLAHVMQDNDRGTQLDTASAFNDAMSFTFEDIAELDSFLEEETEAEKVVAEGEETPETGRGNDQPLSEDDDIFFPAGNAAGSQNTPPAPRVNDTRSSNTRSRPNLGSLPQAQPSQVYPPAQASSGYFQPMPYQHMPYQPMPYQPMPYHPGPYQPGPYQPGSYQPMPQQYPPYSMPGNTVSQEGTQPPHTQPSQHDDSANQLGNYGLASSASMAMNRGSYDSTWYSGEPLRYSPYPQLPNQNSSEGRPRATAPANTHLTLRPENAAGGSTTAYRNQLPANSGPHPGPSLPPNTSAPVQRQAWDHRPAGSGSEDMRGGNSHPRYTGFVPQSGSDFRPRTPSQLGPSVATPRPQNAILPRSHETPQQYMPPPQSVMGSKQVTEQEIQQLSRNIFNDRFPRYLRNNNLTEETCPPASRKDLEALCEALARAQHRRNQHSSREPARASSQRIEVPEPGNLATDAYQSQIPQVTTPEAERKRHSNEGLRDQPVLNVKVIMLGAKIMAKQRRGQPFTNLPRVTVEDVQEFRLQYRSMPVFTWPPELPVPDDKVEAILQGMQLLGFSLAELWQLSEHGEPTKSATGTQSAGPSQSAQLPGMAQPGDDGHVPEYLLDEFMEILEIGGEQEALRFLRESKAKAAQQSQGSDQSRRKRRTAIRGMNDTSPRERTERFALDDIFEPRDDDPYGDHLAFGRMHNNMDIGIDDDPSDFGIMEIKNERGQIMARGSSRDNVDSSPVLNRTIEIHIDDDLVGAAESTTPVEKFRRLMDSSPTQGSPKKRPRV